MLAVLPALLEARQEFADLATQFYRSEQNRFGVPAVTDTFATFREDYSGRYLEHVLNRVLPHPALAPQRPGGERSPSGGRLVDDMDIRQLAPAVARHAQMAARSHTMTLIDEDARVLGWARAPSGTETCGFCWMLVSRGAVYKTERSARQGENGESYHDRCDCVPVPVFDRASWPGRNSYLWATERWKEVTKGYSGRDALNAYRRYIEDPKRDQELPRAA